MPYCSTLRTLVIIGKLTSPSICTRALPVRKWL
jgi:hypothetical protein